MQPFNPQLEDGEPALFSAFKSAWQGVLQAPRGKSLAEPLVFMCVNTPLGPMLAMAEVRGLVMLEFLDRPILLREVQELRNRYGYAISEGKNQHLVLIEDELARYFAGSLTRFTVPLHTPGSVFQCQVWDVLRQLPYGKTCTYGEIALLLGKPGASRAVGLANGSNRMSIVLPCHRVIGANGSLTGYGGGKSRKEFLLRLERASLPMVEQGQFVF